MRSSSSHLRHDFIHLGGPFCVEPLLIRVKVAEELQKLSRMDPLFVGNILQHCLGELVVNRFGKLHVHLHCLIFGSHQETNCPHQFLVGQFTVMGQPGEGCSKVRHCSYLLCCVVIMRTATG